KPTPAYRIDRSRSFSNALCFATTLIDPNYGAGFPRNWAAIGRGDNGGVLPVWNPTWINFRGNMVLGHKMSTAISTSVGFFNPQTGGGACPDIIKTSDGSYTGDFSFLFLGNPPSTAAFGRIAVQGNAGQLQPGIQLFISNYSQNSAGVVAGTITTIAA